MVNYPTLITGIIRDENNNIISNAVIQITQIDKYKNTVTDKCKF